MREYRYFYLLNQPNDIRYSNILVDLNEHVVIIVVSNRV